MLLFSKHTYVTYPVWSGRVLKDLRIYSTIHNKVYDLLSWSNDQPVPVEPLIGTVRVLTTLY